MILTSLALISGATWARFVAVVVAGLSALVQLFLIPMQAWWSIIVITIDVLIIYAVISHREKLRIRETPPNVNS